MTVNDFQEILIASLTERKEINHIIGSDNSVLVSCNDNFSFFVNIMESKGIYIQNDTDEKGMEEYFATHTDEEFARDIVDMTAVHPGFFYCFMVFKKLEEMSIIDYGLFSHIMDNIVFHQNEFDKFMIRLLNHYRLGEQ